MALRDIISKITPFLVVTAVCGGLGGAIFSWYINRPKPAILTYVISTTTTGADPTTKSLIPNLILRIGDEDIKAIHTHAIELSVTNGFAESAPLAVMFDRPVRLFGHLEQKPTPLHSISCDVIPEGMKCGLAPLDPRETSRYRILIATDSATPPKLATTARNVELATLEEFTSRTDPRILYAYWGAFVLVFINLVAFWFSRRRMSP